jgi:hypothetical protein
MYAMSVSDIGDVQPIHRDVLPRCTDVRDVSMSRMYRCTAYEILDIANGHPGHRGHPEYIAKSAYEKQRKSVKFGEIREIAAKFGDSDVPTCEIYIAMYTRCILAMDRGTSRGRRTSRVHRDVRDVHDVSRTSGHRGHQNTSKYIGTSRCIWMYAMSQTIHPKYIRKYSMYRDVPDVHAMYRCPAVMPGCRPDQLIPPSRAFGMSRHRPEFGILSKTQFFSIASRPCRG